jgi:hypothetical protein
MAVPEGRQAKLGIESAAEFLRPTKLESGNPMPKDGRVFEREGLGKSRRSRALKPSVRVSGNGGNLMDTPRRDSGNRGQ